MRSFSGATMSLPQGNYGPSLCRIAFRYPSGLAIASGQSSRNRIEVHQRRALAKQGYYRSPIIESPASLPLGVTYDDGWRLGRGAYVVYGRPVSSRAWRGRILRWILAVAGETIWIFGDDAW